jgi:hypothetical protein
VWLTYSPEGTDEPREWWFKFERMKETELELMLKLSNADDMTEFKKGFVSQNPLERRLVLWTLLRREHPTLKLSDVDFFSDEFTMELDAQEIGEAIQAAEKQEANGELTPEQKRSVVYLRDELEKAKPAEGKALAKK